MRTNCIIMRNIVALLFGIMPLTLLLGQTTEPPRIFTEKEYLQWVKAWHPLVKQANLLTAEAKALLMAARGGFDPKLYADWQQKSFDGKNYFSIGEGGFKIPTWYGLEIKGYYNATNGVFLNPENNLPAVGQAVAGVRATLGQGLFIDERRAALQSAKILQNANEAERQDIINDILLDATLAYWDWAKVFYEMEVIERALAVARVRLQAIVASFNEGDMAAVDTLEAYIQMQNREFELNDAQLAYRNAGLMLSNFLWYEDNIPLEITDRLRPQSLTEEDTRILPQPVEAFLENFDAVHPLLRFYQLKISQLDIERRLAAEYLKPQLDVEYNLLGEGFRFGQVSGPDNGTGSNLLLQNYKWGLNFSFPLFLRKERGKLDLTRIKIQDTDFTLQQKRLELTNKVRDAYNEWQNTARQITLYADITENYRTLFNAETTRFALGESSVFLVNIREQRFIEAQLKFVKLQSDFYKNRNKVSWAAGRLVLQ